MNEIKPKFKIGDNVELKSGGPEMTISKLHMNLNISTAKFDDFTGNVDCQWFIDGKRQEELFHQDTLDTVD